MVEREIWLLRAAPRVQDRATTTLLDQAFAMLASLPAETQDDVARALIGMTEVMDVDDIEPEHRAAVLEGMRQAEKGEFAARDTDAIVADAFRRNK